MRGSARARDDGARRQRLDSCSICVFPTISTSFGDLSWGFFVSLLSRLARKAAKSKVFKKALGAVADVVPGGKLAKTVASKLISAGAAVRANRIKRNQAKSVEAQAVKIGAALDNMPKPGVRSMPSTPSDWEPRRSAPPRKRSKSRAKSSTRKPRSGGDRPKESDFGNTGEFEIALEAWQKKKKPAKSKPKAKKVPKSQRPKQKRTPPKGGLDLRAMREAHKAAGEPVPWREWVKDKANHIRKA